MKEIKHKWSKEQLPHGYLTAPPAYASFVNQNKIHNGVVFGDESPRFLGEKCGLLRVEHDAAVAFLKYAAAELKWGDSKLKQTRAALQLALSNCNSLRPYLLSGPEDVDKFRQIDTAEDNLGETIRLGRISQRKPHFATLKTSKSNPSPASPINTATNIVAGKSPLSVTTGRFNLIPLPGDPATGERQKDPLKGHVDKAIMEAELYRLDKWFCLQKKPEGSNASHLTRPLIWYWCHRRAQEAVDLYWRFFGIARGDCIGSPDMSMGHLHLQQIPQKVLGPDNAVILALFSPISKGNLERANEFIGSLRGKEVSDKLVNFQSSYIY